MYCNWHTEYDGETAPDLACKVCCTMFVSKIREKQYDANFKPMEAPVIDTTKNNVVIFPLKRRFKNGN